MHISFGVRLDIREEGIGRNDGGIDVLQDRRFDLRHNVIDVIDGIIDFRYGSFKICIFDVRHNGIKISDSRVGIIDNPRHLVIHHSFEVMGDGGEVTGDAIYICKGIFDVIAFDLSAQTRHKRIHAMDGLIHILDRAIQMCEELTLQVLHETGDVCRG